MRKTIYLISGPLGVGKTSVSRQIHKTLDKSALIEGDVFLHKLDGQDKKWEEKLEFSWKKILALTKKHLNKNLNVIIDFVVEEELPWFCGQVSSPDVTIKYVVLTTDKNTLIKRLKKRGELKYLNRSLVLLDKLSKNPKNKKYLYTTTDKKIPIIAAKIIGSSKFIVS